MSTCSLQNISLRYCPAEEFSPFGERYPQLSAHLVPPSRESAGQVHLTEKGIMPNSPYDIKACQLTTNWQIQKVFAQSFGKICISFYQLTFPVKADLQRITAVTESLSQKAMSGLSWDGSFQWKILQISFQKAIIMDTWSWSFRIEQLEPQNINTMEFSTAKFTQGSSNSQTHSGSVPTFIILSNCYNTRQVYWEKIRVLKKIIIMINFMLHILPQ